MEKDSDIKEKVIIMLYESILDKFKPCIKYPKGNDKNDYLRICWIIQFHNKLLKDIKNYANLKYFAGGNIQNEALEKITEKDINLIKSNLRWMVLNLPILRKSVNKKNL